MSDKQGIPDSVASQIKEFHQSLAELKNTLQPVLDEMKDIQSKAAQDPESQANLDLTICFAVNSLYWMHQVTNGKNPKDEDIRIELDRIKKYMVRLQEIKERKNRMKLNKHAAKAFVRGALFDHRLSETAQLLSQSNSDRKKQKKS